MPGGSARAQFLPLHFQPRYAALPRRFISLSLPPFASRIIARSLHRMLISSDFILMPRLGTR